MHNPYYLFNPGRMSRKDNTLCFVAVDENGNEVKTKHLPIMQVDNLYIFGSIDANSALYNFLGKSGVSVHFFDYYEHYTGSFYPKEYLLAGKTQVEQTKAYLDKKHRLYLAQQLVTGAQGNILRNLKYYNNRGKDLDGHIERIETYENSIKHTATVSELMGIEGNIRSTYYAAWDVILPDLFPMGARVKRPPSNEVNALISFGNSLCYTLALDAIYHTQLNPTISFLHEPGVRRFSLALDVAEIFKPFLVDRTIFTTLNKGMLKPEHFVQTLRGCTLTDAGRRIFLETWTERLKQTIQHRSLNRKVSFQELVRLECFKIAKYLLEKTPYKPFVIWW